MPMNLGEFEDYPCGSSEHDPWGNRSYSWNTEFAEAGDEIAPIPDPEVTEYERSQKNLLSKHLRRTTHGPTRQSEVTTLRNGLKRNLARLSKLSRQRRLSISQAAFSDYRKNEEEFITYVFKNDINTVLERLLTFHRSVTEDIAYLRGNEFHLLSPPDGFDPPDFTEDDVVDLQKELSEGFKLEFENIHGWAKEVCGTNIVRADYLKEEDRVYDNCTNTYGSARSHVNTALSSLVKNSNFTPAFQEYFKAVQRKNCITVRDTGCSDRDLDEKNFMEQRCRPPRSLQQYSRQLLEFQSREHAREAGNREGSAPLTEFSDELHFDILWGDSEDGVALSRTGRETQAQGLDSISVSAAPSSTGSSGDHTAIAVVGTAKEGFESTFPYRSRWEGVNFTSYGQDSNGRWSLAQGDRSDAHSTKAGTSVISRI